MMVHMMEHRLLEHMKVLQTLLQHILVSLALHNTQKHMKDQLIISKHIRRHMLVKQFTKLNGKERMLNNMQV